jgi:hypothetical protein
METMLYGLVSKSHKIASDDLGMATFLPQHSSHNHQYLLIGRLGLVDAPVLTGGWVFYIHSSTPEHLPGYGRRRQYGIGKITKNIPIRLH